MWERLHSLTVKVVKSGAIPKHIAIIMDGNRRFARKNHMETGHGHALGFEKLRETLEWCLEVGVEVVTVYAFSIENFKRSQTEVDGLMQLAKEKFLKLLEKSDIIEQHQVCVRVLGDMSMLPEDLQIVLSKVVHSSRLHKRAVLNVCFAYTARHEIFHAASLVNDGVRGGQLLPDDVSEGLMEQCLYTHPSPPPDLLIRTSGEVRLSDFLLWQSAYSCLVFADVLWPEFSFWHFIACILRYQWSQAELDNAREAHGMLLELQQREADIAEARRQGGEKNLPAAVARLKQQREARVAAFLEHVRSREEAFYAKMAALPVR